MAIQILTIAMAASILLIVFELIRQEKLTFKYAFGWIVVSVLAIIVTVFDDILIGIASWLGFQLASNFIFFSLLSVFVFLCLLMTIFLCQQNNRNDTIAQKMARLEHEVEQLKKKSLSSNAVK